MIAFFIEFIVVFQDERGAVFEFIGTGFNEFADGGNGAYIIDEGIFFHENLLYSFSNARKACCPERGKGFFALLFVSYKK